MSAIAALVATEFELTERCDWISIASDQYLNRLETRVKSPLQIRRLDRRATGCDLVV